MRAERLPLDEVLAWRHPFRVMRDNHSYFIEFPDLPGCITQAKNAKDIGPMAEDARRAWIITAYDLGREIPRPGDLFEPQRSPEMDHPRGERPDPDGPDPAFSSPAREGSRLKASTGSGKHAAASKSGLSG